MGKLLDRVAFALISTHFRSISTLISLRKISTSSEAIEKTMAMNLRRRLNATTTGVEWPQYDGELEILTIVEWERLRMEIGTSNA